MGSRPTAGGRLRCEKSIIPTVGRSSHPGAGGRMTGGGDGSARPPGPRLPWSRLGLFVGAGAAAMGVPILIGGSATGFHGVTVDLPTAAVDLGLSFIRMVTAYLLSLGFALLYGYVAASN